jgi:hypothetical protein
MTLLPRIFRFLFVAVILATVTILFLRGRDPAFLDFHRRTPSEVAWNRVIKLINFRQLPLWKALDELSSAAGIKIECDAPMAAYGNKIDLHAEQITLGDAVRRLLAEVGPAEALTCELDDDRIRIGYAHAMAEPLYVDEYVLRALTAGLIVRPQTNWPAGLSLFTSSPTAPIFPVPRLYGDQNLTAIDLLAAGTNETAAPEDIGVRWGSHLFVLSPDSLHQRRQDVLQALRPESTAAERRTLPFGTELLEFKDGAFSPRDSRAAHDALGAAAPVLIPRQPLGQAVQALGRRFGVRIAFIDDAFDLNPHVELNEKDITLATALCKLLRQASADTGGFEPDRDTIWVSDDADPMLRRVYDLRNYFGSFSDDQRSAQAGQILAALAENGGVGKQAFLGSILVMDGKWEELELNEQSLLKFLNARTGANGGKRHSSP